MVKVIKVAEKNEQEKEFDLLMGRVNTERANLEQLEKEGKVKVAELKKLDGEIADAKERVDVESIRLEKLKKECEAQSRTLGDTVKQTQIVQKHLQDEETKALSMKALQEAELKRVQDLTVVAKTKLVELEADYKSKAEAMLVELNGLTALNEGMEKKFKQAEAEEAALMDSVAAGELSLKEINGEIESEKKIRDGLLAQVVSLNEEMIEVREDFTDLKSSKVVLEKQLAELQKEVAEETAKVEEQKLVMLNLLKREKQVGEAAKRITEYYKKAGLEITI